MKVSRLLMFGGILAGAVVTSAAYLPGCGADLVDGPLRKRFASRPPAQAFEFVFDRNVPQRVKNLAVTGEVWPGGINVWLRFNAPAEVVAQLTAGYQHQTGEDASTSMDDVRQFSDSGLKRYDPENRLRWTTLYDVRRVKTFRRDIESSGWTGIWIDKDQGTVYVFRFGI